MRGFSLLAGELTISGLAKPPGIERLDQNRFGGV
jgi:hypothetical protein